jgi:hypothetical protein
VSLTVTGQLAFAAPVTALVLAADATLAELPLVEPQPATASTAANVPAAHADLMDLFMCIKMATDPMAWISNR